MADAVSILLVQGANMNWLGRRQPELYGTTTAAELDAMLLGAAGAALSGSAADRGAARRAR